MLSELAISGPVAWILMALPVVVLLAVAGHALFRRRRVSNTGSAAGPSSLVSSGSEAREHRSDAAQDLESVELEGSETGLANFSGALDGDNRFSLLNETDVAGARARVSELESSSMRDGELATLYLRIGEWSVRQGDRNDGMEFVRKSVSLAHSLGDVRVQAQGRMVMAAVAVEAGDRAGACEQWQLARELFLDDGLDTVGHKVSAHMHRCGCPSDWVLTQF